jgi:hypothetical protein
MKIYNNIYKKISWNLKSMMAISFINIEWNKYNGFVFQIGYICSNKIDGSFFSINFSKRFLYIEIFWKEYKIYENLIT